MLSEADRFPRSVPSALPRECQLNHRRTVSAMGLIATIQAGMAVRATPTHHHRWGFGRSGLGSGVDLVVMLVITDGSLGCNGLGGRCSDMAPIAVRAAVGAGCFSLRFDSLTDWPRPQQSPFHLVI